MTNFELTRVLFSLGALGLLMLSTAGNIYATNFMLVFYSVIGFLSFLGVVYKMAGLPVNESGLVGYPVLSILIVQCIHLVAVLHLYLLGYTLMALPVITLQVINIFANIIRKREKA